MQSANSAYSLNARNDQQNKSILKQDVSQLQVQTTAQANSGRADLYFQLKTVAQGDLHQANYEEHRSWFCMPIAMPQGSSGQWQRFQGSDLMTWKNILFFGNDSLGSSFLHEVKV
jgi:hypothetical protein